MKAFKNIQEVKEGLENVNSCATATDRFMAQCFPLLIEALGNGKKLKPKRISAYNRFVSKGLKAGKAMGQIGREWQECKKVTP